MNNKTENEEKKEKKKKLLLLLLLLLLLIVFVSALTVLAFRLKKNSAPIAPDFAPSNTERHAEPIGDDEDKKLDQPKGGGAVSITYSKQIEISKSEKKARLMFANPTRSNQDMVLQLIIDNTEIFSTGRLSPGNRITMLDITEAAEKRLSEGGYNGKFIVSYYDSTSGEKAVVNTEIPVTITVKK